MPATETRIGVRVPADLLDRIDRDADRLGLSRSALIRARLEHPDPADAAVLLDAADQLRALLDQVQTGQLSATPLAAPHLAGAVSALDAVSG